MELERFLILLMGCSTMTTLTVEAIGKMIGEKKIPCNILAAIVSVVISGAAAAAWVILTETQLTAKVWIYIIALVVMSWMCAMLGYDKVKQAIVQIRSGKD